MMGRDTASKSSDPAPTLPGSSDSDGVDVTLIRWLLSLTPRERLRVLEQNVESILRLRRAGRQA
jgi:hypothetical protein